MALWLANYTPDQAVSGFRPLRLSSWARRPNLTVSCLRWLETVSSTYILMGHYNYSLSLDATVMVSKNCPTIGKHVVIIFVTR